MFMPTVMLIFRKNFTEVIEINTTFRAKQVQEQHVNIGTCNSYVNVRCIVRTVSDTGAGGLNVLRQLCSACDVTAKLQKYQESLKLPCHDADDKKPEGELTKPCDLSYTELTHPEMFAAAVVADERPRTDKPQPVTDVFDFLPIADGGVVETLVKHFSGLDTK